MNKRFWFGLVELVLLVLFVAGIATSPVQAGRSVKAWTPLYVSNGVPWAIKTKEETPCGPGCAYNAYVPMHGDGFSHSTFVLTGLINGHGYLVFLAGGEGDPIRIDTDQPTWISYMGEVPWMSPDWRNLQVKVIMQPDRGVMTIDKPGVILGQPPMP